MAATDRIRAATLRGTCTLVMALALGCATTDVDPGDDVQYQDDREADFYEEECPDCAPSGAPIPGESL